MFSPEEFYHFAFELNSNPKKSQACIRSIISRMYYAAFLAARDKDNIKAGYRENIHEKVYNHYYDKKKTKLSNHLKTLRILRNDADYITDKDFKDTSKAITQAKAIFAELKIKL